MRYTLACALFGAAALAALAAPAAQPEAPAVAKARLTSSNNLKQIGLAMHAFHDAYQKFPSDVLTKDGKALLSWRVAILPYIEEGDLYKQFKLDEPWDSEANKKLIEKMPRTYTPVRGKVNPGETFYQVFAAEGLVFVPGKPSLPFSKITDGTSNTGMVFEAGEPVVWTKPQDLAFDPKKPLPKLGGMFDGAFHVALCDGSVVRIPAGADEGELKKLIMPADGEAADLKKLK